MRSGAAAAVFLAAGVASATVIADPSIEHLAALATAVVRGEVLGSEVVEARGSLETLTRVRVAEGLKGALLPGAVVTVRQPGGALGNRRVAVEGAARLADGEQALLFLQPDGAGRYVLTSLAAAKFSLAGGVAWRDLSNLGVAVSQGRGPLVVRPAQAEPPTPAPALLARIRRAVSR